MVGSLHGSEKATERQRRAEGSAGIANISSPTRRYLSFIIQSGNDCDMRAGIDQPLESNEPPPLRIIAWFAADFAAVGPDHIGSVQ